MALVRAEVFKNVPLSCGEPEVSQEKSYNIDKAVEKWFLAVKGRRSHRALDPREDPVAPWSADSRPPRHRSADLKRHVYVDHNATTRVRPEVAAEMAACLEGPPGNPSSRHSFGQVARSLREQARDRVAAALGSDPDGVIFTSGGTEADNLALRSLLSGRRRHLVTAATEHEAVLHTAHALEKEGVEVTVVPVDSSGRVDPDGVARAIRPDTGLVSVMAANNETGVLLDLVAVGSRCRDAGVPFHTDAVQSFGKVPWNLRELPVDLVSISSHKIGGPKGVGALATTPGIALSPLQTGGGQEHGFRPGTENLPGIVGFGKAAELAVKDLPALTERWSALRDSLERGLFDLFSRLVINGASNARLPNTSHVSFPGMSGESLLIALDLDGVAVSTGAACNAGASEPSHVLLAMGLGRHLANASVRFSFGWDSAESDVEMVLDVIPAILDRLTSAEAATGPGLD